MQIIDNFQVRFGQLTPGDLFRFMGQIYVCAHVVAEKIDKKIGISLVDGESFIFGQTQLVEPIYKSLLTID